MSDSFTIEVENTSRLYGPAVSQVKALDNVSLKIKKHEFVSVTGPSGSGKSTLLHLLGGLDRPDSGEVRVAGVDLRRAKERELTLFRREKLGIVFQFFHLLPTMTLAENISLPLLLAGKNAEIALNRAMELLELVGLEKRAKHFPHQLSGGEMQRGAVARALAHRPELLLADEPTGNLDSHSALQVMELLQKIASAELTTMLVVTHSDDVSRFARRRIEMRDGRIAHDNLL